jgi:hypothetical protein
LSDAIHRRTQPTDAWLLVSGSRWLLGETVLELQMREISQIDDRLRGQVVMVRGGTYPTWVRSTRTRLHAGEWPTRSRRTLSFPGPAPVLVRRKHAAGHGAGVHLRLRSSVRLADDPPARSSLFQKRPGPSHQCATASRPGLLDATVPPAGKGHQVLATNRRVIQGRPDATA